MKIVYDHQLQSEHLVELVEGRILAVVIKDFYERERARQLANSILSDSAVQPYTHEMKSGEDLVQAYFGVDRLGFPFNATYHAGPEDDVVKTYYDQAKASILRLRELAQGQITPIDKLRLLLDESFATGSNVAAFEGKKMLAGIGRITKAHLSHLSADQPHYDALPEKYAVLDAQIAANVYLKVPEKGGELEVWNVDPLRPMSEVPADWRAELPPSVLIKPDVGDLVLFNCRRPHAVQSFKGEDRVTVQMFIGYQRGKPLLVWN